MMQSQSTGTRRTVLRIFAIAALAVVITAPVIAEAALRGRHYYGGWSYYPRRTYYYTYYYYKPYSNYDGYKYHYCVYYTSRPRYVYYYNPSTQVYWGRYDVEDKGYSLLAEKDRKKDLKDIPEEAFPKAGEMPAIPDSEDGEKMLPIDPASLPKSEEPKDAPER